MENKFLDTLNGNPQDVPPIWFMRQAGRHLPEYLKVRESAKDFIDFCLSPEKATEVTLQPVRRYDMDAAILFADILLIPLALGQDVSFKTGIGPVLEPLAVHDIQGLDPTDSTDKISNVYETVSKVRNGLSKDKALIGFCGGPWTVATYMLEGKGTHNKETAKRFAYENPQEMETLLNCLSIASADYLIGQAKAGADALKIFESWAEGLTPYQFETLVISPTQMIIERVRAAGIDVPIIGFPRGAGSKVVDYSQATGVNALAIGSDMSLQTVRSHIGVDTVLQGNLDPLALRIGGTVLEEAVDRVLKDASGPHIFNLGHGVTPDVKIENVHAVIRHVRTGERNYV